VAKGSAGVIPVKFVRKHDTECSGRGTALNEGYMKSSGELLLFLRADALVPPGWDLVVRRELSRPEVLLGSFQFAIDRTALTTRGVEPVGLWLLEQYFNARARWLSLPSAMQGFAITAEHFHPRRFSDNVIMDDVEFVLHCRQDCLVAQAGKGSATSSSSGGAGAAAAAAAPSSSFASSGRSPSMLSAAGLAEHSDHGRSTQEHSKQGHPRHARATSAADSTDRTTAEETQSRDAPTAATAAATAAGPGIRTPASEIVVMDLPLRCSPTRWEAMGVLLWLSLDALAHILFANVRLSPSQVLTVCYDVLPSLLKRKPSYAQFAARH